MRHPLIICFLLGLRLATRAAETASIPFETDFLRLAISADAQTVAVVDRATGRDWLRQHRPVPFASIRIGGRDIPASAAGFTNSILTLRFGDTGVEAQLRVEARPSHLLFHVEAVTGGDVDKLTFLNAPLDLKGSPGEPFGACVLSLNLATRVDALPALQSDLRASCEKAFGLVGAKAAIVAAPMDRLRPALQETLAGASELPVCRVAGPWARDIPFNHGSYLFNFGTLTETNVDEWIEMTRSLGFTQIDNHGGGGFFRFGDMELNREKWPEGWEAWRRIAARLHAQGIGSIFHTYAFFIDKRSKYVTPVPDPRLDAFRTFTLAEPLTADATEITVNESTAGMKTITGFFEHNSVVLHLGDELVTFGKVSQEAPWRFGEVKRGALGTKASAHPAGTRARHLKECFGLFVPDVESTLFEEIAANHAEVVDRCGFDGLYLDAIDGSSILRGGDACWYWANKFVVEIQKRLKKPVGMEMSAMWHHFWQYRTRWQAWDYPQRGHRRFLDLHAAEVNGGLLLPLHLGWWNFQSFQPPQIEPSYPDVMENLGAKLIGWDAGISLTGGVDRNALKNTPLFRRAVEILRTCEDLRHANAFEEPTKARLREPGREFALTQDAAGRTRFRRVQSEARTLSPAEPWTLSWTITNVFAPQPIQVRIEALMSAAAAEDTNAVSFLPADRAAARSWKATQAAGVTLSMEPAPDGAEAGWVLAATNSGQVAQRGAWGRRDQHFEPVLNLKSRPALRLEVEGDGSGALLAVRQESPHHLAYGAVADRYLPIDFTGRRQVVLLETESTRWNDYEWNDGKGLYNVYRETVDFGAIEKMSLWLQNLPTNRPTRIRLGALQGVPIRPIPVRNPRLTVGSASVEFPIELAPGSWIEAHGPGDCQAFGPKGESLGRVEPRGPWPQTAAGASRVEFACEPANAAMPRARVTFFHQGEML